jgi:hypothetical protein
MDDDFSNKADDNEDEKENEEEEGLERTLVYDENFNSELSDEPGFCNSDTNSDHSRRRPSVKYFKITYTKEEIHSLGEFNFFLIFKLINENKLYFTAKNFHRSTYFTNFYKRKILQ